MLWGNAGLPKPIDIAPAGHGWTVADNKLEMVWFHGHQTKASVTLQDSDKEDSDNDEVQVHSESSDDDSIDEDEQLR